LVTSSAAAVSEPTITATIPWTASRPLASRSRSVRSAPLPSSPLANSWMSVSSLVSAWPLSRTILRKKKSMPWMAVVPSYSVSIFASRMYCSSG
jgi:hypothetical protein